MILRRLKGDEFGGKIAAIRVLREITGLGLREAKDFVASLPRVFDGARNDYDIELLQTVFEFDVVDLRAAFESARAGEAAALEKVAEMQEESERCVRRNHSTDAALDRCGIRIDALEHNLRTSRAERDEAMEKLAEMRRISAEDRAALASLRAGLVEMADWCADWKAHVTPNTYGPGVELALGKVLDRLAALGIEPQKEQL